MTFEPADSERKRLKVSERESRRRVRGGPEKRGREQERGRGRRKSHNGLAVLFVAFLELFMIAMETRHRYQKYREVWQRVSDTIPSATDARRSQLLGPGEQGAFVADFSFLLKSQIT